MPRDVKAFISEIHKHQKSLRRRGGGYSESGSRVMPVLQLYAGLALFEERRAFQDALELLLRDEDAEVRSFAVDICLGFFVFRDAIK